MRDKLFRERPFPMVEAAIGLGLYIHDCMVEIPDRRGRMHRFMIYFTRHMLQPLNSCLLNLNAGAHWPGQILVLKIGRRDPNAYVNLRGEDKGMADAAVKR